MDAQHWVAPEYLRVKRKLRILILGTYASKSMRRLTELKLYLVLDKYVQTRLVKDFKYPTQNPDESQSALNLRKSEYWIPKADINVFVFFPSVDNTGVAYELKHLCDNYPDMAWRSIVAISTKPAPQISSLVNGLIERWSRSIQQVYFITDKQLQEAIRGGLTNLLERLYFSTVDRQMGEWERDPI